MKTETIEALGAALAMVHADLFGDQKDHVAIEETVLDRAFQHLMESAHRVEQDIQNTRQRVWVEMIKQSKRMRQRGALDRVLQALRVHRVNLTDLNNALGELEGEIG